MNQYQRRTIDDAIADGCALLTAKLNKGRGGSNLSLVLPVATNIKIELLIDNLEDTDFYLKLECSKNVNLGYKSPEFEITKPKAKPVKLYVDVGPENVSGINGCMYALYGWYSVMVPGNLRDGEIIETVLSLVRTFLDTGVSTKFEGALTSFNMTWRDVPNTTFRDDIEKLKMKYNHLSEILKEINSESGVDQGFLDCLTGTLISMIFLMMGNRVHPETFKDYFYRRYNAFAAVTGNPAVATVLKKIGFLPDCTSCMRVHDVVGGMFEVRRQIFLTIRTYVSDSKRPFAKQLKILLIYFAYTEMTEIELISRFLLNKYPEILALKDLVGDWKKLIAAYEYLCTLTEEETPYAKILYPEEQTYCLNKANFDMIAAAAHIVAVKCDPSYKDYKCASSADIDRMRELINSYIDVCNKSGIKRSPLLDSYEAKEMGSAPTRAFIRD